MLPQDPYILLSTVNTRLRDQYSSLRDLCLAENVTEEYFTERFREIDYRYDPDTNQFIGRKESST